MTDAWEGLFRVWHERSHNLDPALLADLLELERRIVKLEAYVASRRRARVPEELGGPRR